MAVATDGDPGLWPVPSDAADETAQVTAHFDPEGVLPGRSNTATGRLVAVS
jgi:hypothetical protein